MPQDQAVFLTVPVPIGEFELKRIELEKCCEKCYGSGFVSSPAWKEFWNENPDFDATQEGVKLPDGPEEVTCHECKGSGWQLTNNGQAILTLITRHAGI